MTALNALINPASGTVVLSSIAVIAEWAKVAQDAVADTVLAVMLVSIVYKKNKPLLHCWIIQNKGAIKRLLSCLMAIKKPH